MENEFTKYEDHLAKFQEAIASNSYAHAEYMYGVPVEPEGYENYKREKAKLLTLREKEFKDYEDHLTMFQDAVASNSYAHAEHMYGLPVKPEGYDDYKKGKY